MAEMLVTVMKRASIVTSPPTLNMFSLSRIWKRKVCFRLCDFYSDLFKYLKKLHFKRRLKGHFLRTLLQQKRSRDGLDLENCTKFVHFCKWMSWMDLKQLDLIKCLVRY